MWGGGELQVERVLDVRQAARGREALIRWRGRHYTRDTWELEQDVMPHSLITGFLSSQRKVYINLSQPLAILRECILRECTQKHLKFQRFWDGRLGEAYAHTLRIDTLIFREVALAVLEHIRGLVPNLELQHSESGDVTLRVTDLDQVAQVVGFHLPAPGERAVGCGGLRIKCADDRADEHLLKVFELVLTYHESYLEPEPAVGLVVERVPGIRAPRRGPAFTVALSTVLFHATTGAATWPRVPKAHEQLSAERKEQIVEHAREELAQEWVHAPLVHGLATKGWHRLPPTVEKTPSTNAVLKIPNFTRVPPPKAVASTQTDVERAFLGGREGPYRYRPTETEGVPFCDMLTCRELLGTALGLGTLGLLFLTYTLPGPGAQAVQAVWARLGKLVGNGGASEAPPWSVALALALASSTDNFAVGLSVALAASRLPLHVNLIISACNAVAALASDSVGALVGDELPVLAPAGAALIFAYLAVEEFNSWRAKEAASPLARNAAAGVVWRLALPMSCDNLATGVAAGAAGVGPALAALLALLASFIMMAGGFFLGRTLGRLVERCIEPRILSISIFLMVAGFQLKDAADAALAAAVRAACSAGS